MRGLAEQYETLRNLSHPALAKIYYISQNGQDVCLIEEYIKGELLSTLLEKQGHFGDKQVVDIIVQLCLCLEYLHTNNVIHRDIKPSNIILTEEGKVKLIDFDASRQMDEQKQTDTRYLGTKGYAPPEQYGFAQTDYRSDIYALGVTAKELLGKDYKGALLNIFDRCTKLDPQNRVQSVVELRKLLTKKDRKKQILLVVTLLVALALAAVLLQPEKTPVTPPVQDKPTTEQQVEKKIEQQPEKVTEKQEQKVQEKAPEPSSKYIAQDKIKVTANDWSTFKKLPQENRVRLNKQGMWIYVKFENNSNTALRNPTMQIKLYDMVVQSENRDIDAGWARHTTQLSDVDAKTNLYKSATVKIYYNLKPQDWGALQFNPGYYLITGPNPRATITFMADNYEKVTTEYKVTIVE